MIPVLCAKQLGHVCKFGSEYMAVWMSMLYKFYNVLVCTIDKYPISYYQSNVMHITS